MSFLNEFFGLSIASLDTFNKNIFHFTKAQDKLMKNLH